MNNNSFDDLLRQALLDAAEDIEWGVPQEDVKIKRRFSIKKPALALAGLMAAVLVFFTVNAHARNTVKEWTVNIFRGSSTIQTYSPTEDRSGKNTDDLPVIPIQTVWVFSPDNYQEMVGGHAYVFVGVVRSNDGTTAITKHIDKNDPTSGSYSDIYTNYTIEVIENIKGSLMPEVEVVKRGGVSPSGDYIELYEGDSLPEVGEKYIFIAGVDSHGQLYLGMPNTNIPYSDDELEKIKQAYEHQVEIRSNHLKSKYDTANQQFSDEAEELLEQVFDSGLIDYETEMPVSEFFAECSYPLAAPRFFPEGWVLYDSVFFRPTDETQAEKTIFTRMWYNAEKRAVLTVTVFTYENWEVPDGLRGIGFMSSTYDELGEPISIHYPWATQRCSEEKVMDGLYVSGYIAASDRMTEYECRSILDSIDTVYWPSGAEW